MTIIVLETQQTNQNRRSKQWSQTKTEATNLRLNQSNPYEKKKKKIKTEQPIKTIWNQNQIKPIKSIWNQNQIKPIKRIYPSNANQTHHQSQPPPTPPSSHIKPTVDQPIKPTTEFQNQETKTLDLHKIKLHGRKRKEAPPCAYRKERERERERENGLGRETMLPISSFNWCWELLHIGPPRPRWHFTSQCWKS